MLSTGRIQRFAAPITDDLPRSRNGAGHRHVSIGGGRMDITISCTVNGERRKVTSEAQRPLLDVLREDLQLTGTKYGCGEGECGACTVLVDGKRVRTCQLAVEQAEGKNIVTIEGLARGGELHPIQQAFLAENAFQCGYCTSGMLMSAIALLEQTPKPTRQQVVAWMERNVCRCCSHVRI